MATLQAVGVSALVQPRDNENHAENFAASATMDFKATDTEAFFDTSGNNDGSSRFKNSWNTIFVDNQNAFAITVQTMGVMMSFTVPPQSNGYYPLLTPNGQCQFKFKRAVAGAALSVPFVLLTAAFEPSVWKIT